MCGGIRNISAPKASGAVGAPTLLQAGDLAVVFRNQLARLSGPLGETLVKTLECLILGNHEGTSPLHQNDVWWGAERREQLDQRLRREFFSKLVVFSDDLRRTFVSHQT